MSDVERCKAQVWETWHSHQCSRKAWKDGYCKQHHPEQAKARRMAKKARRLEAREGKP